MGETTIRFFTSSSPMRNGWNMAGAASCKAVGICEVAVHGLRELRVAEAQVFLGDAPAAGQQVEGELRGVLVLVLADALEPFQARPGRRAGWTPPRAGARPRRRTARIRRPGVRGGKPPGRGNLPWRAWCRNRWRSARCGRHRPRSTTLLWRQLWLRTVLKFSHLELLDRTSWPSSSSAKIERILAIAFSSDTPGGKTSVAVSSKPAARHTSSCISTMNVEPSSEYG